MTMPLVGGKSISRHEIVMPAFGVIGAHFHKSPFLYSLIVFQLALINYPLLCGNFHFPRPILWLLFFTGQHETYCYLLVLGSLFVPRPGSLPASTPPTPSRLAGWMLECCVIPMCPPLNRLCLCR